MSGRESGEKEGKETGDTDARHKIYIIMWCKIYIYIITFGGFKYMVVLNYFYNINIIPLEKGRHFTK